MSSIKVYSVLAWDVIISPLADDDIVSPVPTQVVDLVVVMAQMLDEDFLTGTLGP
jgi:hypothetical protein